MKQKIKQSFLISFVFGSRLQMNICKWSKEEFIFCVFYLAILVSFMHYIMQYKNKNGAGVVVYAFLYFDIGQKGPRGSENRPAVLPSTASGFLKIQLPEPFFAVNRTFQCSIKSSCNTLCFLFMIYVKLLHFMHVLLVFAFCFVLFVCNLLCMHTCSVHRLY